MCGKTTQAVRETNVGDWRTDPFDPDWCSPPGGTIKDILRVRSPILSVEELGKRIGLDLHTTLDLLEGDALLTPAIAKGLSEVLGSSVEFWLNREQHYREGLAKGLKRV